MRLKRGRGYISADRNFDEDLSLGYIPIDSVHTPVKKVNYTVEAARLGQNTEFDKLTIEVWTDGSVKPEDSIGLAAKLIKDHMSIFINFEEDTDDFAYSKMERPPLPRNDQLDRSVDELELSVRSYNCLKNADIRTIREIKFIEGLLDNLARVMIQLPKGKWIHDGYSERNYDAGDVIFRPVFVAGFGDRLLWQNGQKFLLMSATILTDMVMASELGLNLDDKRVFDIIDVPSSFPVENRPIHVVPIADMTFDNMQNGDVKDKMARAIEGVLRRHPDVRVLIHCVSYDLARYLYTSILESGRVQGRALITYSDSRGKNDALDDYKRISNAVLFAPSMDRGVDLPDDLCRVQVIAKIPYPNLGDKRINARLYSPGGQGWYSMHTIRTIVQMAGRGVRHREDWAITYVFDGQFGEIWRKNSRMFPRYIRDALNFRFNPRLLTEAL
jgi:Rad3-related DNA helicase